MKQRSPLREFADTAGFLLAGVGFFFALFAVLFNVFHLGA